MATDWLDGRLARRSGRTSALGSLLDPIADKVLVLSVLIVLVDRGAFPGWMVAAIVAREFLVSGLRLAAIERGTVLHARDLGKLKTWSQAVAAGLGGLAVAGAFDEAVAWWALLVALVLTWVRASTTRGWRRGSCARPRPPRAEAVPWPAARPSASGCGRRRLARAGGGSEAQRRLERAPLAVARVRPDCHVHGCSTKARPRSADGVARRRRP